MGSLNNTKCNVRLKSGIPGPDRVLAWEQAERKLAAAKLRYVLGSCNHNDLFYTPFP